MSASEKSVVPRETEETGVVTVEPVGVMVLPRFDKAAMANAIKNYQALSDVLRERMRKGYHYGKFPGWTKDQLLEPGASLILNGFSIYADPVRIDRAEDEDGHYRYNIVVHLKPLGRPDAVVAAGVGSASTREVKYAYRWVPEEEIPRDLPKDDLKSREGHGGKAIFRIPNEDVGDLENTVLKMATKRAEIDAVNHLPGVSELFPTGQKEGDSSPSTHSPSPSQSRSSPGEQTVRGTGPPKGAPAAVPSPAASQPGEDHAPPGDGEEDPAVAALINEISEIFKSDYGEPWARGQHTLFVERMDALSQKEGRLVQIQDVRDAEFLEALAHDLKGFRPPARR